MQVHRWGLEVQRWPKYWFQPQSQGANPQGELGGHVHEGTVRQTALGMIPSGIFSFGKTNIL